LCEVTTLSNVFFSSGVNTEKQRMEASLVELEPLRMVLEEKEEEEEVNVRGRVGQWRSVEWVLVDVVLVTELTGKDDAIAAVVSKPITQDIIPSSSTSPNSRERKRERKRERERDHSSPKPDETKKR